MKAIILCAGKGERLKPLTSNIPKPMIPINGKPLLEYLILLCKKYGIRDIAINTSYLPEKIKEYFGDGSKFGVDIRYSFEQELLGAAGALNNFRDFLDSSEPFIVLYGDNITDVNLDKMIKFHKEKKALATLFLHKQEMADEKTTPGAVVFDAENRITNIIENPNKKQIEFLKNIPDNRKLTNSGIYILNPEVLEFIPEDFSDFARDIFPELIKKGKNLFAYYSDCYFKEVGQLSRYNLAKQEIESGKVKLKL